MVDPFPDGRVPSDDYGTAYADFPSPTQMEETQEDALVMTTVVPELAVAGTKLRCTAPDGQELRLTVPEGVPPGSVMTLTLDPVSRQWKCMAEPIDSSALQSEMPEMSPT